MLFVSYLKCRVELDRICIQFFCKKFLPYIVFVFCQTPKLIDKDKNKKFEFTNFSLTKTKNTKFCIQLNINEPVGC